MVRFVAVRSTMEWFGPASGLVRPGAAGRGSVGLGRAFGSARLGIVGRGAVCLGTLRFGAASYGLVRPGAARYDWVCGKPCKGEAEYAVIW